MCSSSTVLFSTPLAGTQFTPQQLAGGIVFGSRTRVGNWNEDIALEEAQRAEFASRKAGGGLAMQRRQAKLNAGNAPTTLTSNDDDGFVYFGDDICLDHDLSGMRLAVDVWDEIVPGRGVFLASGIPCPSDQAPGGGRSSSGRAAPRQSSTGPEPAARSTFRIVKAYEDDDNMTTTANDSDGGEGESKESAAPAEREPVLYGTPFRLISHMRADAASVEAGLLAPKPPMFLASSMKSQALASRLTNRQLCFAMARPADPETLFLFERATHDSSEASAADNAKL